MLVYKDYFNADVSIYISHITIFTFATHIILVSHYLPVQTHHSGKEIEKKSLDSIILLT